ncbi:hypothetical protein LTR28_005423, partial [Elasticomyces elasticus]
MLASRVKCAAARRAKRLVQRFRKRKSTQHISLNNYLLFTAKSTYQPPLHTSGQTSSDISSARRFSFVPTPPELYSPTAVAEGIEADRERALMQLTGETPPVANPSPRLLDPPPRIRYSVHSGSYTSKPASEVRKSTRFLHPVVSQVISTATRSSASSQTETLLSFRSSTRDDADASPLFSPAPGTATRRPRNNRVTLSKFAKEMACGEVQVIPQTPSMPRDNTPLDHSENPLSNSLRPVKEAEPGSSAKTASSEEESLHSVPSAIKTAELVRVLPPRTVQIPGKRVKSIQPQQDSDTRRKTQVPCTRHLDSMPPPCQAESSTTAAGRPQCLTRPPTTANVTLMQASRLTTPAAPVSKPWIASASTGFKHDSLPYLPVQQPMMMLHDQQPTTSIQRQTAPVRLYPAPSGLEHALPSPLRPCQPPKSLSRPTTIQDSNGIVPHDVKAPRPTPPSIRRKPLSSTSTLSQLPATRPPLPETGPSTTTRPAPTNRTTSLTPQQNPQQIPLIGSLPAWSRKSHDATRVFASPATTAPATKRPQRKEETRWTRGRWSRFFTPTHILEEEERELALLD